MFLKLLSQIYIMLRFDLRLWQVLEMRLDKSMTLEEIGQHFGVTRERIRQIERRAWNQFVKHSRLITHVLDLLEKNIKVKNAYNRDELISHVLDILQKGQFVGSESEVRCLILLVRALVFLEPHNEERGMIEKRWPRFSFMACKLDPIVTKHIRATIYAAEEKERKRRRKLSYTELSLMILKDEGKPLHWKEIADRAYHFGHRESFNSTALYNSLMNHPKLFVRVNAGTYALSEWGINEAEYYQEIIASLFREERKALSSESIYHRVNEKRQIKRTTLIMLLDMYPRFYKSLENTYGLRAWLSPREKQTLRTPEWLVEDIESFKRLINASLRGYDIENMIKLDLVQD